MLPVLLLLTAIVAFRLIPTGWENFSPMAAVVLCSAACLPRRWAFALPFAAFAISEVALNLRYGVAPVNPNTFSVLIGFALIFALGWSIRGTADRPAGFAGPGAPAMPVANGPRLPLLFGGALLGSVLFYAVTNTGAWVASPQYAKSFAGWLQALTTGVPGFPPTWVFFRNSLAGDLFFTGLFVALYGLPQRRWSHRLPASRPAAPSAPAAAHSHWNS